MKFLTTSTSLIALVLSIVMLTSCGSDESNKESSVTNNSNSVTSSSTISTPAVPSTLPQQINQYLNAHQNDNSPGISILVLKDGEEIYRASKGMANFNSGTTISHKTGFRLASVSKPFTAIAIMQLIEKGELTLSDSVLDYIPELSPTWKAITIDNLLSHQSGINDIFNDSWNSSIINNLTMDGLIAYLSNHPALEFPPGTKGDYSNTGYMLLATIIERKTGLRFSEYMARYVFEPANMNGSYINDEYQDIKHGDAINYADRYTYYGVTTYLKGSMAQVSSTDDFSHFFDALRKGKLVSNQTLSTMTSKHSWLGFVNYGYGFIVTDNSYSHSGQWDGFETELVIDKRRHLEWVILTNSGSAGRNHINAINALIRSAY